MKFSTFSALVGLATAAPYDEEVTSIPGYPDIDNF
jgi:hypothetical protein